MKHHWGFPHLRWSHGHLWIVWSCRDRGCNTERQRRLI